ncbi:uncharacterized protein [Miscanthus floridulus]|uniref:uncharacterized protein isoform X3 n=1 Tax=Miscanthus floridulus TaxID=154761 RepID=UPI0034575EE3
MGGMTSIFNQSAIDEYEEHYYAWDSIPLEESREPENLLLQAFRQNEDKHRVSAEYEGLCALESILVEGTMKPENLSLQALRYSRDEYGADEYEELSALESTLEGSTKPENLSLQVLRHITNSFSKERIIGRGGCAEVYKGILPNGRLVAVKKFYSHCTIDDKQFDQEVQSLIRAEHKNIVQFLGYCSHTEKRAMEYKKTFIYAEIREMLLCFEYISNGSLQNHLTDELRGEEWHTRLQIIRGISEGLHYLHNEKRIIHMDLKPLNILLDDDMVPKITDFGISRFDGKSQTMSKERHYTLGYCAPEYRSNGKFSLKSDIYSLGVIILELVTGSKEMCSITNVCRRWRHRWRKSGKHIRLEYQQVTKCLELALRCMSEQPTDRPHIKDIITELNEMATDKHIISNTIESTVSKNISLPDDMLGIEPLELQLPVKLQSQISRSIKLSNVTDDSIAFRISTSSTLPYCIKPENGILPRQSYCEVTVTLDAKKAPDYKNSKTGEFNVESTRVDEGLTTANITDDVFREEADKVVDKTCLRDSTELLQVYPRELSYPLDDLNRVLSFSLQLTNRTNDYVGFLFPMSSSKVMKYSWSRSKGILPPWSTWVVILKVQAQEAALLNAQDKDNVIVRSAILSNDLKPEDVSLALFEKKTDVQDVMLDIVFVAPSSQQQSSLHVPPLEDQDVQDTTIMISSGGSIVTEFVEIYPSVLCFPFEPNKSIRSSISLVNKSEHAFCFIITLNTPDDKAYINIDVDQDYIWPHSTCSVHVTMKNDEYPLLHLGDIRILMMTCGSSELIFKPMSHPVGKHPQLIKRIREGGGWACEVSLMAVICNPEQATEATKKKEAIYIHEDFGPVLCMDVHPTQPCRIVTAHSKYICLWKKEPETSAYVKTSFTEFCNIFTCVKFIARTHWIVSGDNHGLIHVYTYNDGLKKKNRFRAHNGRIKSLAIHSTRPYLLSSSDDRISLWNWDLDCKIAQVFFTVDCVRHIEFNAKDTMTFFNSCYKTGKFQDLDGSGTGSDILIWTNNDTKWHQMNMHAGPADVACCVQGIDRKYLYLAIGDSTCGMIHKCTTRVQIWDVLSNRCVHTLEILVNDETRVDEWLNDDGTQIVAIACHPERPLLVHGTNRGDVYLWNFHTCRLEKTLSFGDGSIQGFGFIDTERIKRLVIGFDDRIEMVEIDWPALTSHPGKS